MFVCFVSAPLVRSAGYAKLAYVSDALYPPPPYYEKR